MIGRPGKDGDRPVKLLGKHDPDQLVRENGRAEGKHQVRLGELRAIMTVGAADAENRFPYPFIPPLADLPRQLA